MGRLRAAAEELEARCASDLLEDADTDGELRTWLDGDDTSLPWAVIEPGESRTVTIGDRL